jgi:putative tryptophan/tyrosine transport system substrate-binding protein
MTRKIFYVALGALLLALCRPVEAQQPKKIPRIGYLVASDTTNSFRGNPSSSARAWLHDRTSPRSTLYSEGKLDRLPELAAELVRLKVDITWQQEGPGWS